MSRRRALLDFGAALLLAAVATSVVVWLSLVLTAADRIGVGPVLRAVL